MGTLNRYIKVFSIPLQIEIRNPTHQIPSCDNAPLLIFSAIGEDQVSNDLDGVRVFIDNREVSIERVGEPYGYDYYGADGYLGTADDKYGADGVPGDIEEFGEDGLGADGIYGTADDNLGADGIIGTADDGLGADGTYGTSWKKSRFGYGADDTYGSDGIPGTTHVYQLPAMENGHHTLKLIVKSNSGLYTEVTEVFIVDTAAPVITIMSPLDDTINPLSEIPTLEYAIEDYTGILKVNVNIDEIDYGWIASGAKLDFLKSGLHTITITAHDTAINECFEGNIVIESVQFNLLKPIELDKISSHFYIGTDSFTQSNTADAVIEEFRILDIMSTDEDIAEDFKLLRAKIRFQLQEGEATISADEALLLSQMNIDATNNRINKPDNTLVLCHFDSNVNSIPGVGSLENPSSNIIDENVASRRVDVTVNYYENTYVDRELIEHLIQRITPAFIEVSVMFNAVSQ